MKALLYLASGMLVAPGALLAYGFWTLTEAIAQENFFKFLYYLLMHALDLFVYGIWVIIAGTIIWVTLAFLPRYRCIGACAMGVIALLSLMEILVTAWTGKVDGELFLPALLMAGFGINGWLIYEDVYKTRSRSRAS